MAPTAGPAEHRTIAIEPLGAYSNLDPNGITVSGISSGAFFAHQFHVACSGLVKGAGMVAGGLYACAEQVDGVVPPFGNPFTGIPKSVVASLAVCTRFGRDGFAQLLWSFPNKPDAAESRKAAMAAHAVGAIDDPANLAGARVWLFHGHKDIGVPRSTMEEMKAFYRLMGVPAANIDEKEGPDAEHGMPIKSQPPGTTGPHCKLPDRRSAGIIPHSAAEDARGLRARLCRPARRRRHWPAHAGGGPDHLSHCRLSAPSYSRRSSWRSRSKP